MTPRAERRTQRRPTTRFTVCAVVAACASLSALLGAEPQATGTITGHVVLTTKMRGVPISTRAYAPRAATAQGAQASPDMRSVVVYLKDVAYAGPLPVTTAEIRQEQESFSPRVVAVTRGSSVTFPNFDPYFHNVFSLSRAASFDLGRFAAGQRRTRQFDKAGLVKVYCHIHSQMSASILVLDHPFFAIPEEDGTFTLPQVPAGDYTLVGWHERVGEQTVRLSVQAGRTTVAALALPVVDAR